MRTTTPFRQLPGVEKTIVEEVRVTGFDGLVLSAAPTVVLSVRPNKSAWDNTTLTKFFGKLGARRSADTTDVSADQAQWIADVVADKAVNAARCEDQFHIVAWATEALDVVRRQAWNDALALTRNPGRASSDCSSSPRTAGHASKLEGTRFALLKNPDSLTDRQNVKLAWIAQADPRLYRGYLLKGGRRVVSKLPLAEAKVALDDRVSWARRCRIPAFVKLQGSILKHRASILAAI